MFENSHFHGKQTLSLMLLFMTAAVNFELM